ncbi:hypothetical protein [Streptomyces sp. NPDC054783]
MKYPGESEEFVIWLMEALFPSVVDDAVLSVDVTAEPVLVDAQGTAVGTARPRCGSVLVDLVHGP